MLVRKQSNARHHPPPQAIDLHESRRVGGRVHAVVGRQGRGITLDTQADSLPCLTIFFSFVRARLQPKANSAVFLATMR